MSPRMSAVPLVLFAALPFGCAGSPPPAEAPPEPAPALTSEPAPTLDADATPANAGAPTAGAAGDLPGPPAEGPAVAETRTSDVIAKVVLDNRKPFRDCFDQGLKQDKTLRGTMTLHFVIDPTGKVIMAELNKARSDVTLPLVVDCALAVLRGMKFPASSRGMETTINYPFDFKN